MEAEGKTTLHELLFGIVLFMLIEMAGNLWTKRPLTYSLGVLLGTAIAVFMLFHMYTSLKRAMRYDEETAVRKTKQASMLRMAVMVAGIAAGVLLRGVFSYAGVLLGILTLKFAAYLQPLTHKIFTKILRKGR